MTEFKVGDRVRITNDESDYYNQVGPIAEVAGHRVVFPIGVGLDEHCFPIPFSPDELELVVSTTDPIDVTRQDESPLAEWEVELLERAERQNEDDLFPQYGDAWHAEMLAEQGEAPLRARVLDEAKELILGDRNNQYGPPDQDFQRTADALNAFGFRKAVAPGSDLPISTITSQDVATIQILVKLSRAQWSPKKKDHWVDIAGYAGCAAECAQAE